ncbi:hypothetical protein Kfla_1426 [Kribbella flavida DSM 17836]|uniref:Uncharacterized protein n=1 Tax=Kribbella flavida (strain DSM 17836 / JCM 10339 / NBRC 14399) TaxID=479435 RepID=D2PKL5_KRIFD|nr:hypothetical protein [Kribbella flavida]ADB30527.1 hypothetical protein Kfla_1426 [Kribbella flavida DSM 17836]
MSTAPAEQGRSLNRVLLRHLLISIGCALLLIAAFGLAGTSPRPLWFVALALAVGFLSVAVRLVFPQLLETTWPTRYDEKWAALRTRSNDNRTQFLATWVQEASRERRTGEGSLTFERRIRPLLLELTTDRLVHRHGIDPALEPERAKALVGDQLWQLITGTESRTASYAELEQAVQTIEKL